MLTFDWRGKGPYTTHMRLFPNKSGLILLASLLLLLPWLSGGKDILAQVLAFFILILGLFTVWRLPQINGPKLSLFGISGLAFLVWCAASLLWSVNRYDSLRFLILMVMAAGVFVLAQQIRASEASVRTWVNSYLGIATLFSLHGIWLYLVGEYERLTGSFYWANPAATFLLPAVLLSIWYFASTAHKWYLLIGAIMTAAFWLTESRGAFLVLALVVLACLVRLRRPKTFWFRTAAFMLLSASLAFGFTASRSNQDVEQQLEINQGSRFAEAVRGESSSGQDRYFYLQSALQIWQDYPFKGSGAGTFGTLHPNYQLRVVSAGTNAHNLFVQILSELGLVGALLFTGMILGLLAGIWRGVRQDGRYWPLATGFLAVSLHFLLDIGASYPANLFLAASLAGIAYLAKAKEGATFSYMPGLVLAGLIVLALPMLSLYQSYLAQQNGEYYQEAGDYRLAQEYFGLAHSNVAYNPDVINAEGINFYTLAQSNIDREANLRLAQDRSRQAIKLDPNDSQHPFLLAKIQRLSGSISESELQFRAALRLDPYNRPAYYEELSTLLFEMGRLVEAEQIVASGISLYPDSVINNRNADENIKPSVAQLYFLRSRIRLAQNNRVGASEDAAKSLELRPAVKSIIEYRLNNGL